MIPRSILKGIFLKCKPRASGDDPEQYDIEVYAWE